MIGPQFDPSINNFKYSPEKYVLYLKNDKFGNKTVAAQKKGIWTWIKANLGPNRKNYNLATIWSTIHGNPSDSPLGTKLSKTLLKDLTTRYLQFLHSTDQRANSLFSSQFPSERRRLQVSTVASLNENHGLDVELATNDCIKLRVTPEIRTALNRLNISYFSTAYTDSYLKTADAKKLLEELDAQKRAKLSQPSRPANSESPATGRLLARGPSIKHLTIPLPAQKPAVPSNQAVVSLLESLTIKAEITSDSGVKIFSSATNPAQSHENLRSTLNYLGIEFTENENDSFLINETQLPPLLEYLEKEQSLLQAIQKRFDNLYQDRVDKKWGIKIVSNGIGSYKIDIPGGPNQTKKYMSVYNLLKLVRAHTYPEGVYPIFNKQYIENFNATATDPTLKRGHGELLGLQALERIEALFQSTDLAKEQLKGVLKYVDPKLAERAQMSVGSKPLNDLYQKNELFKMAVAEKSANTLQTPSRPAPAQNSSSQKFVETFQVDVAMAEKLHGEEGEVILPPDSFSLSTYSDKIQKFLECCFTQGDLKAANNNPKIFLENTRGNTGEAKEHRCNIGMTQWGTIYDLANQFRFMQQSLGQKPEKPVEQLLFDGFTTLNGTARLANNNFSILLKEYQTQMANRLEQIIKRKYSEVPQNILTMLLGLRTNKSRDIDDVYKLTNEIITSFLDNHTQIFSSQGHSPGREFTLKLQSYITTLEMLSETKQNPTQLLNELGIREPSEVNKYINLDGTWNYSNIQKDLPLLFLQKSLDSLTIRTAHQTRTYVPAYTPERHHHPVRTATYVNQAVDLYQSATSSRER